MFYKFSFFVHTFTYFIIKFQMILLDSKANIATGGALKSRQQRYSWVVGILKRNWDKNLKTFAPYYSQSPPPADFTLLYDFLRLS
jgi:hypothetical protein